MTTSILKAALAYAEGSLGFLVFPTGPDCRRPLCEHGVHDATGDTAVITKWWTRHPNANIGLATGGGRFVLDIDCKGADGFASLTELEREHGALPLTWTASTPSGGEHRWFATPLGRQLRNRVGFRPGLDIRSTGGSVAAPPSRKPVGVYTWVHRPSVTALAPAPEWLLALIDPPAPPRPATPPIKVGSTEKLARYLSAAVDGEAREVARTPPNAGRNQRLFQAAANLGELVGAGLLPLSVVEDALEAAAHDCHLVRDDGLRSVRATIASGVARGVANPREVAA